MKQEQIEEEQRLVEVKPHKHTILADFLKKLEGKLSGTDRKAFIVS